MAFITAILALPGSISNLIAQIGSLISTMEKSIAAQNAYNNIQQANKITQTEIPNAKTTEDNQKIAKEIQDLVSKS